MFTKNYKPRFLPERSYLYLRYPQEKPGKFIDIYIPFLENIEISESQKPNLSTYDLLGRPGNLFAYYGAKSRELKLKFNITLPNVIEYLTEYTMSSKFDPNYRMYNDNKESEKQRFRTGRKGDIQSNLNIDFFTLNSDEFIELYKDFELTNLAVSRTATATKVQKVDTSILKKAVNRVLFWVGAARSTVLNNATNTSLGPPTVYLMHGSMYRNIPCICTSVSVKLKENYGYELLSLTPRLIEISMDLSENRVGDFGKFEPFDQIKGNNIAGWEAIIKHGTTDSYSNIYDKSPRNLLDYYYDGLINRARTIEDPRTFVPYSYQQTTGAGFRSNEAGTGSVTNDADVTAAKLKTKSDLFQQSQEGNENIDRSGNPDNDVSLAKFKTQNDLAGNSFDILGPNPELNNRTIEALKPAKGVGKDIPYLGRRPGPGRAGFNKVWDTKDNPFK
jgi:hypothetical protein